MPESEALVPELPGRVGRYCWAAGSDVVRYGGPGGGSLGSVCGELFNGECELYRSFGLNGVIVARYGSEEHDGRFVNATITEFDKVTGAFGFFTRRALGDSHPEAMTVSPLALPPAQGRALLGAGVLYVWRGRRVVEFAYLSEDQTPEELRATSAELLPAFALAAANSLGGLGEVPFEARFLEAESASPAAVSLLPDRLLDIQGTGPGAVGYLKEPGGPHRVILALRPDEAGARDLVRIFRQGLGAPPTLKKDARLKVRRQRPGHEPEVWAFTRYGRAVLGVGADELAPQAMSPERAERRLNELVARLQKAELPPR